MANSKDNLIELMATHEETLSQLYQLYGQKYDYYQAFWNDIASEEIDHARWLHALNEKVERGELSFDEHLFKLPAITAALEFLDKKLTQARMEDIPVLSALSISRDLENSMLEQKFFIVFKSDSPELKKVFSELEEATITHAHKIKDLLDNQGQLPID
jgi:rubrerythrin